MNLKITLLLFLLAFSVSPLSAETLLAETPEAVVELQLEAYNARDIDAFVATYAEDIEIYDATGKLIMEGHEQLYKRYDALFKNTPNLCCRIENRITINNKVIDKENVIMNDRIVEAVAIYEVTDGKIMKVTFVK